MHNNQSKESSNSSGAAVRQQADAAASAQRVQVASGGFSDADGASDAVRVQAARSGQQAAAQLQHGAAPHGALATADSAVAAGDAALEQGLRNHTAGRETGADDEVATEEGTADVLAAGVHEDVR